VRQPPDKTDFLPKIRFNVCCDNSKKDLLTLNTVDLKVYFDTGHCVHKKKTLKSLKELKILSIFH
jgi:hypothetical protein